MSSRNVEALREGYAALGRGDLAGALAVLDADVEVEDHELSLGSPITRRGHGGFVEILTTVNEGFEEVRYRPEEFIEVGDRVLVKARRTGRGAASGARVEEQQFHVFDFAQDRVVRFRSVLREERALEAAGLASGS